MQYVRPETTRFQFVENEEEQHLKSLPTLTPEEIFSQIYSLHLHGRGRKHMFGKTNRTNEPPS